MKHSFRMVVSFDKIQFERKKKCDVVARFFCCDKSFDKIQFERKKKCDVVARFFL